MPAAAGSAGAVSASIRLRDGLHAADQQLHLDRLGEVVVRPDTEARKLLILLAQRREKYHHRVAQLRILADGTAGLRTVHDGHHHVQQDQVRTALGGGLQRLGAVLRREYFVALLLEVVPHEFEGCRFHRRQAGCGGSWFRLTGFVSHAAIGRGCVPLISRAKLANFRLNRSVAREKWLYLRDLYTSVYMEIKNVY